MHRILAINADAVADLPQRPDRRRRAGRDGVRQLGRRAGRRRVPAPSRLAYTRARAEAGLQARRRRTASAFRHIVFTKGGGQWLEDDRRRSVPDVVGSRLDGPIWARARPSRRRPRRAARQPRPRCALFAGEAADPCGGRGDRWRASTDVPTQQRNGHIFNLGHGISQFTPQEHVAVTRRGRPQPCHGRLPRFVARRELTITDRTAGNTAIRPVSERSGA